MTLADKVTSVRLILSPVFFVIYLLPRFFPAIFAISPPLGWSFPYVGARWTVPVLWVIFVVSELTDMLDGMAARKLGQVSDFGKLYDPFADTLTQLTFFLCFVIDGIFPPLLFLVVIYREFGMLFVRNLMLKKGIALGARMGGKIKTVTYILAAGLALLASSFPRLGLDGEVQRMIVCAAKVVFTLSAAISVISFIDYLAVYRKTSALKKPSAE